ncbi:MAG: 3-hydroxyacyl-CoA dehydrogenase NAD-binding domain-containing protein, partial [Gemmatimonadota bacterium]
MAKIGTVAVAGCGLMGSGIVEIAARSGYETWVREVNGELLDKGRQRIQKSLDRAVEKGKLEADARDEALARLRTTTELKDLAG